MPIVARDRVTVLGLAGVHRVKEIAPVLDPSHRSCLITLGYAYGRHLPGDTISVDLWRCNRVPVDLETIPA